MARRGATVLLAVLVAACSDDAGGQVASLRARRPREAAAETPRAARPGESDTETQVAGDAAEASSESQARPPDVTLDTLVLRLQEAGRDRARGTGAMAGAIRRDEALARATARLLRTTGDEVVLAGAVRMVELGALRGRLDVVRDDLLAALGTPGPPSRRRAAARAMRELEQPLDLGTQTTMVAQLAVESDAAAIRALAESSDGRLTPETRAALLTCLSRLEVPSEPPPSREQPARLARRAAFKVLAADAVLREDWEPLVVRAETASQTERQDIVQAFTASGWRVPKSWNPGDDHAAARREWLSRLYRATESAQDRGQLINSGTLGLRALEISTGTDELSVRGRRESAAMLRKLIETESDPGALALLRLMLQYADR